MQWAKLLFTKQRKRRSVVMGWNGGHDFANDEMW